LTLLEFHAMTLITTDLHVREIINGALFVLCGVLSFILAFFMAKTWHDCRLANLCGEHEDWRSIPGIQSACVVSWILGIISLRSGLAWLSLKKMNDGINLNPAFEQWASWTLIGSAIILAIATLRGTYIWTPPKWHNRAWTLSLGATILFLLASEYLL